MFQNKSIQACTPKSRGTRAWPIRRCCEHGCARCRMSQYRVAWIKGYQACGQPSATVSMHVCVSEKQIKVASKDQSLHGIGRPTAAVSIDMCVAEYINSGLHSSVKGYNGLADQLLLREHTCDMCVAEKINSGLIWPTTS